MERTVHQRKRAYSMQIDWTSSSAPALYCVPSRPSNWTFSSAPALYWCPFQAQQLDIFTSTSIVLMFLPGPATGHFYQHQHCIDVPSRPSNWTFSSAPALYWCPFQAQQLRQPAEDWGLASSQSGTVRSLLCGHHCGLLSTTQPLFGSVPKTHFVSGSFGLRLWMLGLIFMWV